MSTNLQTSPPTKEFSATIEMPPWSTRKNSTPPVTAPLGRHGRFEWTVSAEFCTVVAQMTVTCRNLYEEDPDWVLGASFHVTNVDRDEERTLQHDFTAKGPKKVWITPVTNEKSPTTIKIVMTIKDNFKRFDVPEQFSDICLEVGGEKFHVAKWLLVNQTARFKQMFEEGNLNEATVTLPEEHYFFFNDFLEFLLGEKNVNDNNIYAMMKLAQHYGCPMLQRECETFMREKSKRSIKDIYRLGTVFEMPEVKERAFLLIENSKDLEAFLPNDLDSFSKEEMIKLYQLSQRFNHQKVSAERAQREYREHRQHEHFVAMRERNANVELEQDQAERAERLIQIGQRIDELRRVQRRNAPIPPNILNDRGRGMARRGQFRGIYLGRLRGGGIPRLGRGFLFPREPHLVYFENVDDAAAAAGLFEDDVDVVIGPRDQLRGPLPAPPVRREDQVELLNRIGQRIDVVQRLGRRDEPIPPRILNARGRARREEIRGIFLGGLDLVYFEDPDDAMAAARLLDEHVEVVVGPRDQLQGPLPVHQLRQRGLREDMNEMEARNVWDRLLAPGQDDVVRREERGAHRGGHRGLPRGMPRGRGPYGPPRPGMEPPPVMVENHDPVAAMRRDIAAHFVNRRDNLGPQRLPGDFLGERPPRNPDDDEEDDIYRRAAQRFMDEFGHLRGWDHIFGPGLDEIADRLRMHHDVRGEERGAHHGGHRELPRGGHRHGPPPRPGMEPPPVMVGNRYVPNAERLREIREVLFNLDQLGGPPPPPEGGDQ